MNLCSDLIHFAVIGKNLPSPSFEPTISVLPSENTLGYYPLRYFSHSLTIVPLFKSYSFVKTSHLIPAFRDGLISNTYCRIH